MKKFPTVPLVKAIEQTANWRSFYSKIYSDSELLNNIDPNGEDIFRGFRIPLDDLTQIVEVINAYNEDENNKEKINSIRAYLSKRTDDVERLHDIHVMLVPVVGGKDISPDIIGKDDSIYGRDLLEFDKMRGVVESTIYDFTTPCPTECDTKSKLYSIKSK
ncbi:hypothetical protein HX001_03130 [Empedobacter brevis]|uniref:Uncharacterized protein n=1 Tax=Empedobacter brevis TaxID=247 RepID=A0AAJ1QCH4_9FLAO|nr:hypothetical protein [Empedobacter brevis]MDM1071484.1 hypothetical protein [Empedobacter brevis]